MLFSSITFLYVFLPVVLTAYLLVPKKAKNHVLLVASLFFYFFGEPVYVSLLVISSLSDFVHSLGIEKYRGTKKSKWLLISSIVINLSMLGFFKYIDFFILTFNGLTGLAIPTVNVSLPIGISFFTFQTMSYTIDVYRGNVRAQKNLATMGTFVCLFPQLVAGPIVRYSDIAEELEYREHHLNKVADGIRRFVYGLGKKVLIANAMGELCTLFRSSPDQSVLFYWIYAIAFTLQIYFDFSGYSDMAIGLGKMFGFSFPENFDHPYTSRSVTEFWRRWHMTMGGWFRDYVYIPLGGNRCSKWKWLRNILVVWMVTGFWHGAAWNFVLWGLMFGVLLLVEKLWLGKWLEKAGRVLPHIYLMFIVTISFVVFNATSLPGVWQDLTGMFGGLDIPLISKEALYQLRNFAVPLLVAAAGSTFLPNRLVDKVRSGKVGETIVAVLEPVSIVVLMVLVTACLVDGSFNPFLYFRF